MKEKPLEHQLYLSQLFCIALAIMISLVVSLYYTLETKKASLDMNISNTGLLISTLPEAADLLTEELPSVDFSNRLDALVRELEYIDVITICDTDSIRFYHTNKELLGKSFVGGDETAILNESEPYITNGIGTLGKQRRAFFPIKDEEGQLLGFVMVSVLTASITQLQRRMFLVFIVVGLILIAIGSILSSMLYNKLRKIFFGYRPEEFRKIHIERKEVLDALEEGIFAINAKEELIFMNESAKKILALDKMPAYGTKVTTVYPETKLPYVLHKGEPEYNISLIIKGNHIISNRIPIIENNETIGAVTIFRNKTEYTRLAEELSGAKYMVETLRAFNHEFKNKLHVILGFIEMKQPEKVTNFILNTSVASTVAVSEVTKKIQVPSIAALLIGKIIRASEMGINLTIKPNSSCMGTDLHLPADLYITILGNLIENAIEELNHQTEGIKEIEIGIYIWKGGSILSVDDTGRGIAPSIQPKIFEKDFSTKGEGRGAGMYLIKKVVDQYHGLIEWESEENVGTSFTITFMEEVPYV
ncbi:sensor histidine kinase regulating citrate/malate metabolism [Natranaerovirga hydrolytica]|uniref:histidine kinase n=1 Tax=Natranaerovirga hydrolytica TaxID=680378 RepID=A0A4V2PZA9_9FIRM|nr:sensor histidine kinase [Natranaerovirga hydrolytica]TCK89131.1 sensor histidine kinase regulating citrate/malate metabolism [Natranaerovirga hydrolytica]